MSNYRQIHTKIWKDPWFLDLPPDYKLLFIYLFSNEQANLMGLYPLPIKVICFETELDTETVQSGLEQFAADGKVFYEDHYIWIVNLFRYNANNPNSPKTQAHIRNTLDTVPDIPLKSRMIRHYQQIEGVLEGYDTPSIPVPQEQEQEQEHDQDQKRPAPDGAPPPEQEAKPRTPHQAMFGALLTVYKWDSQLITEKQRGRLNSEAKRLLKADKTPRDVWAAGEWWWENDWRGKKGSTPTYSQLVETLGKVEEAAVTGPAELGAYQ